VNIAKYKQALLFTRDT